MTKSLSATFLAVLAAAGIVLAQAVPFLAASQPLYVRTGEKIFTLVGKFIA